jgi:hypothetical protein
MKINARNVKLAWKYRRALWKYRGVIRHRQEIAAVALAGVAIATALLLRPKLQTEP